MMKNEELQEENYRNKQEINVLKQKIQANIEEVNTLKDKVAQLNKYNKVLSHDKLNELPLKVKNERDDVSMEIKNLLEENNSLRNELKLK